MEAKLDWCQLLEEAITLPGSTGRVYNRFYHYSFLNQVLLRMQGVYEPVATYKRWQSLGRQVVKGAKAKEILRPITVKKTDGDTGEESAFTRFKMVRCLFGVSDTTGEELPPVESPDWNLDLALERLGITEVPFRSLDGNTQGYSTGREISVSPVAVYPHKTRMHEIGHVVLGHTVAASMPDYIQHRGEKEFQAEATAFLTLNELELLTDEARTVSRGYIQHWLEGDLPSTVALRGVFVATDQILKAGMPEQSQAAA